MGAYISKGTVTLTRVTFSNNDWDHKAGAVYNHRKGGAAGGTITMVNCIVSGNTAGDLGGGTCNAEGGSNFNLHNCPWDARRLARAA